jgi:hypothetical protein
MNGLAFFDANILIYADDASSPEKQACAIRVMTDRQRHGLVWIRSLRSARLNCWAVGGWCASRRST